MRRFEPLHSASESPGSLRSSPGSLPPARSLLVVDGARSVAAEQVRTAGKALGCAQMGQLPDVRAGGLDAWWGHAITRSE